MVRVVIHANLRLVNQCATARWLKNGFKQHGIAAEVTTDRQAPGDVHVVQGPHFAYQNWLGQKNVLYLDRTFYGDVFYSISLGWLRSDGSRDFKNENMADPNGVLPELKKEKTGNAAVVFADYNGQVDAEHWRIDAQQRFNPVFLKYHPANGESDFDKDELLNRCDVAIGGKSTVLVDAAINGLRVESYDPLHVAANIHDRQQWLTDLSWAVWTETSLRNGAFWEHLCCE
jgi:hypothetical protein